MATGLRWGVRGPGAVWVWEWRGWGGGGGLWDVREAWESGRGPPLQEIQGGFRACASLLLDAASGNVLRLRWRDEQRGGETQAEEGKAEAGTGTGAEEMEDVAWLEVEEGQAVWILPGLIDSHMHLRHLGNSFEYVDLEACASVDDAVECIAARCRQDGLLGQADDLEEGARAREEGRIGKWIVAVNFSQDKTGGRMITRADLDRATRGTGAACFVYRVCYHVGVANTAALRRTGLLLSEADEDGARATRIVQEMFGGGGVGGAVDVRTGLLTERALELVEPLFDGDNDDDKEKEEDEDVVSEGFDSGSTRERLIQRAMHQSVRYGLTCVQSNDAGCWPLYQRLDAADRLPLRVCLTIDQDELEVSSEKRQRRRPARPFPLFHDPESMLSCDRVKIFADGSLGAKTAAVRQPYVDGAEDDLGVMIHEQDELERRIRVAHQGAVQEPHGEGKDVAVAVNEFHGGWRVEIHVIGDRAVESVLDALAAAERPLDEDTHGCGASTKEESLARRVGPPLLTHCQILGDDLVTRMGEQGVVANIQPSFVPTDAPGLPSRLPHSMFPWLYPWRSLLERRVLVCGGSDAPVETVDPLQGIFDAMYRQYNTARDETEADAARPAFEPQECLSFAQALFLYTLGGAVGAGGGAVCTADGRPRLGAIVPGAKADLVLMSTDVMANPQVMNQHQRGRTAHPVVGVTVNGLPRFATQEWKTSFMRTARGHSDLTEAFARGFASDAGDTGDDAIAPPVLGGPGISGKNGRFPRCRCCVLQSYA